MKNSRSAIAAILFCIAAMVACTHSKTDNAVIPEVSFNKDIIPVLRSSCAINSGCHSGASNTGDNIDLDSASAYNQIISKQLVKTYNPTASLLYVQISSGIMPKAPYPLLSQDKINMVLNWIKQGAKNN
jgi:hypothetical protein